MRRAWKAREESEGLASGLRGRPQIPLNSKRLTVAHMKRLALGLPTTAAGG